MSESFKARIYRAFEVEPPSERGGRRIGWLNYFILSLILLSVLAVMLETVQSLGRRFAGFFFAFEVFSVGVFTVEYVLRIWVCTVDPKYRHSLLGRLRYAARPMSIVDLLAILPFYLPMIDADLRFIRSLRLVRLLRILKIGRYSESVHLLGSALRSKAAELSVMLVVLCILLVLSAGAMYYAESDAQPAVFSSIPESLWWAIITLTTIGYGDAVPVTALGRVLGGIIAVSGIGIVALPTAILAHGFAEEVHRRRPAAGEQRTGAAEGTRTCPHCGKEM